MYSDCGAGVWSQDNTCLNASSDTRAELRDFSVHLWEAAEIYGEEGAPQVYYANVTRQVFQLGPGIFSDTCTLPAAPSIHDYHALISLRGRLLLSPSED